ncbi:hypothetical protein ACIQYG_26385 [Peribacillus sp. NPDC096622]|uniref:hypothetical protein n=1 Tax=Peribacillus sp. NPDC096622 TaxID=3364396 RepID=UPI0038109864
MKKIILSLALLTTLSFSFFNPANASAAYDDARMGKYDSTVTTSRITLTESDDLYIHVGNFSSKTVSAYIFKNGILYSSITGIGWTNVHKKLDVSAGEYSLRLYCGTRSNPTTGCVSYGEIADYYTDNH